MRISAVHLLVTACTIAFFTPYPALSQTAPPAGAGSATAANPRIDARAAWDDRYLYFAFTVDDTDLRGTNTKPMSEAEKDDSIAVYVQPGKQHTDAPDAATYGMVVSVAGGFQFVQGNPATKSFGPHPLFSIKYGVTVSGTMNRSDDRDRTYTVTMAIPLSALGVDSKTVTPGLEFAFNAVARTKDGKLTSLLTSAKTEPDNMSPKQWPRLVLAGPKGDPAAQKAGAIVSVQIKGKVPLIDGNLRDADWPAEGTFGFASPDVPKPAVIVRPTILPGAEADTVPPVISLTVPVKGMERRVLARYLLAFQGDGRKSANPFRGIFAPDGTFFLPEQPASGIGPWFSTDRPAWHRQQLTDMRRTGIDVALIQFSGPQGELGPLDEKSLVTLVTAMREMSAENVPAPSLAPSLETRGLIPQNTSKPDLATSDGRALLYRAVRRWFDIVPPEYRFRVALPPDAEGRVVFAYPFFLDSGDGLTNSGDPAWADELRKQFAADYGAATGGTTLLFVGGQGFTPSAGLCATAPLRAGGAGAGPISAYVVQPGVSNPEIPNDAKPGAVPGFLPRRGGATYREAWDAATAAKATWVIIDSWNDYFRGTAIAASRQYGRQYEDATRISLIALSGLPPRALRWLENDAPRRMRPGQLISITATVQNAGSQILRGTDGISLAYRWRKGRDIVSEGPLHIPLTNALLPSVAARLPIGILAAKPDETGKLMPLPPGDYTLELDLAEEKNGKTVFLSDSAPDVTAPLRAPITVTPLPDSVEIVSATTPSLMVSGGNYGSIIRLRWLGEQPLSADTAQLVYQVVSEDGKDTIFTGTAPLLNNLSPGAWATLPVIIRMGDPSSPVPPAAAEFRKTPTDSSGGYQLRWLLTRRDSAEAVPGQYTEHIAVYPPEEEARVSFKEEKPLEADASALLTVPITVTNRGNLKWTKDGYRLGYHWYYPDGLELEWKPPLTRALPRDVNPGESVTVDMPIRVPDRAGEYILSADILRVPDTYLSTQLITRAGDTALLPVRVTGGRLVFVDLSHLFNVDGIASEENAKDGDLDGMGNSLPAECFPPDDFGIAAYFADPKDKRNAPVYPSGHYCDASPSARAIAFRYAPHKDGIPNAVACDGQHISLGGRYTGLHLVASATGGQEVPAMVTLRYKDGSQQKVTPKVGDWNTGPGVEDPIAIRTPYRRSRSGDTPVICYVRHIIIPVDSARELASIELPREKRVKVFAITLER